MSLSLELYQVDAFTNQLFSGNPAAVVPLQKSLPAQLMQSIAAENNLAETAFIVERGEGLYDIRWFTPAAEVPLCGHATLASALVVCNYLRPNLQRVVFNSASGKLTVNKFNDRYQLNLPARQLISSAIDYTPDACEVVASASTGNGADAKLLLELASESMVEQFTPNFAVIAALPVQGLIITAPAQDENLDFVSRFFAPKIGIDEDPVTGAAHCVLTPYWAKKLDKTRMHAQQISARGGELGCELSGDRVLLSGQGVCFLRGNIELPI